MQFTTPDMREITISDKSEACDFIKDSCKECNRKYECTGENAAFCNHMKNILVAKYGAAEGCLKESRIRHSMGVANFLFAYAKSHDWSKEETEDLYLTGLLHDIGKAVDQEIEGTHIQIGADLCRKYKESKVVINAVEAHHGDVEPESIIACIVQAADAISAGRPGARRETLETYTNRLKQLEDISNSYEGVEKSYAIQAGREVRVMVVPSQVSDDDMVLMARDISKRIESELKYPGQIMVNVIRESRVTDYAK